MAYKLSFETLMEIRERFYKFIKNCESVIEQQFSQDWDDHTYNARKLEREAAISMGSYYAETLGKWHRDDEITREARYDKLNKIMEEFNGFMDIVEFMTFDSSCCGCDVVINFYDYTIKNVYNPNINPQNFRIVFKGMHINYRGNKVGLNVESLVAKVERA